MYGSYISLALGLLLILSNVDAFPDSRNPNLEYEIINPRAPQVHSKPVLEPLTTTSTQRPQLINTPPPPPRDTKNFAYDPISKTWSEVKKNSPPPAEDAFVWNQSNDKWLTMIPRI
ncbi:uncharacterized protein LOC142233185 [Haematobia irritans]|uniref:uncharacterized protein LOC142233185 n=1 Tax=Haematobia irritans TaxID=7368 RepID=UPI003F4FE7EB